MEIPTLTTKINKLKLKISNEEEEILDIDEQIKLLKSQRKEKQQKVETMKEKINDYRAQRKELKQQSKDEEHHEAIEPVNITSIPSDIMHKYIAKYLLDDKRPFVSNITRTKIYKTLETKQDLYLNNLLFGKPRLPFIHKEDFNTFTEHNLNENKYFIQYIERLFKLNFGVEVSINVNVKYFYKQYKKENNKLNWRINIVDLATLFEVATISDFKIFMCYEKYDFFPPSSRTLRRQCMIRDTKIISIISELENYIIEYKKRYTSFVEDFNVFQDDDSDSEDSEDAGF